MGLIKPKSDSEHDLGMTLVIKYRIENHPSLFLMLFYSTEFLEVGVGFPFYEKSSFYFRKMTLK